MTKRKRKQTRGLWISLVIIIAGILFKGYDLSGLGEGFFNQTDSKVERNVKSIDDQKLAQLTFKSGDTPYIYVDNNKSGLDANAWKKNKIIYGDLDHLNRTTQVTGYLSKVNLVRSNTRSSQNWQPTGWHQKSIVLDGKRTEIQNRGHLLAYSITGKFDNDGNYDASKLGSLDNPKNLATQTAFSNQQTMQIFEERIRNELANNKKVIYRVATIFKKDDLMPSGYHAEAISTDHTLNFNVFIWNVQPGVKFDYATGRSKIDRSLTVTEN